MLRYPARPIMLRGEGPIRHSKPSGMCAPVTVTATMHVTSLSEESFAVHRTAWFSPTTRSAVSEVHETSGSPLASAAPVVRVWLVPSSTVTISVGHVMTGGVVSAKKSRVDEA